MSNNQAPRKKTFAESLVEIEASKINSDLANLAQAMFFARAAEQQAKELQGRITALADMIEGGAIVGVDEVKAIYQESRGLSQTERKRL